MSLLKLFTIQPMNLTCLVYHIPIHQTGHLHLYILHLLLLNHQTRTATSGMMPSLLHCITPSSAFNCTLHHTIQGIQLHTASHHPVHLTAHCITPSSASSAHCIYTNQSIQCTPRPPKGKPITHYWPTSRVVSRC